MEYHRGGSEICWELEGVLRGGWIDWMRLIMEGQGEGKRLLLFASSSSSSSILMPLQPFLGYVCRECFLSSPCFWCEARLRCSTVLVLESKKQ